MSSVVESLSSSMAESLSLSNPMPLIPQDVVPCILCRLPVKSLARFRTVSKEWNKIITTPDFITDHIYYTKVKSQNLLVLSQIDKFPHAPLDVDPFYDLYQPPFDGCRRLQAPPNPKGHGAKCVGVVHGVVCIFQGIFSKKATVILWNPIIHKHVSIPIAKDTVVEGFGMDIKTDQLKVLASRTGGSGRVEFEVAPHRDRKWRKLTGVGCDHLGVDNGVVGEHQYHEGYIHWLRYDDCWFLVAFDCDKEKFWRMDLPEELAKCMPPDDCLEREEELVVSNCAGSFSIYRFRKGWACVHIDIWVMCEYAEPSTWGRCFGVPMHGSVMDLRVLLEDRQLVMWIIDETSLTAAHCAVDKRDILRTIEHPTLVSSAKMFTESLFLMDA